MYYSVLQLLTVFGHNSEIHRIVIGKVLHVVAVAHWTIMALTCAALLHCVIVMER